MKLQSIFWLLAFLAQANFSFAQLTQVHTGSCISGPHQLSVGHTATYSVPSTYGQCSECYDWDVSNDKLQILGSDQNNTVTVRRTSLGPVTLSITYFNEDGCHSCNCFDVSIPDYYIDGTQSGAGHIYLLANVTPSSANLTNATYTWHLTYQNNTTATVVTTANPGLVPATANNRIKSATVTVETPECRVHASRTFRCAFPDIDQNGQLFPDCSRGGGGGGLGGGLGLGKSTFKLLSNPTQADVVFKGDNLEEHFIQIYDRFGTLVVAKKRLSEHISLNDAPAGMYVYIISNKDKIVQRGNITKQ